LTNLQQLLRELFQFDLSDLDFGIYKLLRLKRDEIEGFLTEQLPRRVAEVFAGAAQDEQKRIEKEVRELAEKIRQDIDENALTPQGEVKAEFKDSKGKKN
jgi:adenine-specific DNA-methyltransferase